MASELDWVLGEIAFRVYDCITEFTRLGAGTKGLRHGTLVRSFYVQQYLLDRRVGLRPAEVVVNPFGARRSLDAREAKRQSRMTGHKKKAADDSENCKSENLHDKGEYACWDECAANECVTGQKRRGFFRQPYARWQTVTDVTMRCPNCSACSYQIGTA